MATAVSLQAAQVVHLRDEGADAFFTSFNGCVVTTYQISANVGNTRTPGSAAALHSAVNVTISRYDVCTQTAVAFATGTVPLSASEFQIDQTLNSASLNAAAPNLRTNLHGADRADVERHGFNQPGHQRLSRQFARHAHERADSRVVSNRCGVGLGGNCRRRDGARLRVICRPAPEHVGNRFDQLKAQMTRMRAGQLVHSTSIGVLNLEIIHDRNWIFTPAASSRILAFSSMRHIRYHLALQEQRHEAFAL